MGAVRNGCVFNAELPTALDELYVVPDGKTFILKSALLYNNNSTPDNFVIYIVGLAGAPGVLWLQKALEPGPALEWMGWHALSSGGSIVGNSSTPGVYGFLSGALLPNL